MERSNAPTGHIRFGAFELDLRAGELCRKGTKLKLSEQPFQILCVLLESPGEVVSREDLRKRIWPTDTFVDFDHGLYTAITKLRQALGDSSEHPRFIETLPKRGYRFIAPVESSGETSPRIQYSAGLLEIRSPEKDPDNCCLPAKQLAIDRRRLSVPAALLAPRARRGVPARRRLVMAVGVLMALLAALAGFNIESRRERPVNKAGPPHIESLAVLPLENLSRDPEQEYFADGMTEELTADLSKIGTLRVISHTSVMHYKETTKTLPEIARELNVDAVVEGSVRRSGDQVRITAQLIYAPTDRHLWAESYERSLRDVLALQTEVASAIANEVKIKVTPQEQMGLVSARPINPEAHEAYLKGRYVRATRTEEGLKKSLVYFQQAIALEPNYALAYSGLADSYFALWDSGFLAPDEWVAKERAAVLKALQLDDNLGEAHTSLAGLLYNYDRNWAGAEREFRRALELSPSYAPAHSVYAFYLVDMGRHVEAVAEIKKARQLDPLSPGISANVGLILIFARQYDQAVEELNKAIELHPSDSTPHECLALVYLQKRMPKEAIAELRKARRLAASPLEPPLPSELAEVYMMLGEQDRVRKIAKEVEEEAKRTYVKPSEIAIVYAALGEKQNSFAWLEKGFQEHDSALNDLKVDPRLDTLRSDPRFQDLLHRMGLPQ